MKWIFALTLCTSIAAQAPIAQASGRKATKLPQKATRLPKKAPTSSSAGQGQDDAIEEMPDGAAPGAPGSPSKRPSLDSSNTIRINYGYQAWNKDSAKIDSASILMREGTTGRTLRIYLVETEPDSSVFSGLYSINFQNLERLQVEFYIPPQDKIEDINSMKKLIGMINARELKRNPFLLRRSASGQQNVEIFDTAEQARAAFKAYRAEQQVIAMQNQSPTKLPSDQAMETAKLAEELRAKEAAAQALVERVRLEQLEAKRLQELLAQQAALKEAERAAQIAEAQKVAGEGLALFRESRFKEAREKFEKAVSLDPDNRVFYFQYGVTLYKTEDFNRSLVFMNMATGDSVNPNEKQYYIGLNQFRLKDYDAAITAFNKVVEAKDPELSPSAQFYKGVMLFEKQSWEPAQAVFQAVLDTSNDPRLDERAEAYLEQILRIRQFEEEAKRKWQITATLGEMYDSNVLLTSDSQRDTGTASNTEGLRSLLAGSVRYRPLYEETREFAAQLDVLTMYTLDKSFKADQNLRNADPTLLTLTLPYTHKGLLFGKGHKLDITPGYESTFMSIENNETKEILNSYLLNVSNLLVMSNEWFANYNLEVRKDNSKISSSTGNDDSSAVKLKLSNSNLIFVTSDKAKILTADLAYTMNQAQGFNAVYNRTDVSVGWIQPMMWDLTGNLKLGYFMLNYPQNPNNRTDNSVTLTAGASRKISDVWTAGLTTSYNINSSNVEANTYKKLTGLLTMSASFGL